MKPLTGFGAFVIGDEILIGKRQDKHLSFLIRALTARGLRLAWCEYLGDDPDRLTAALRRSFGSQDAVFCFGGIGATPDDHTRQCAAAALGIGMRLHPDAERELRARFGADVTPQRLEMGVFPESAEIIPNPFNRVPGFSLRDHYFLPGFPQMAWPMLEWVLDTRYPELFNRERWVESSVLVYGAGESQLVTILESVTARYPQTKVFCLPSMGADGSRRHIEVGARGNPEQVSAALEAIRAGIRAAGFPFTEP